MPRTEEEWKTEFEKYQQFPEFKMYVGLLRENKTTFDLKFVLIFNFFPVKIRRLQSMTFD